MQKYKFLKPALPLTVICVVIALLLSIVNAITADRIKENAEKDKADAIKSIFPEVASFEKADEKHYTDCVNDAGAVVDKDGNVIGYYADVAPIGFKGNIAMIIGCDLEGKVIKATCLSTAETPAVGTKATEEKYLDTYKALTTPEIEEVDTITGATISSKAVKHGIYDGTLTISRIIEEGK